MLQLVIWLILFVTLEHLLHSRPPLYAVWNISTLADGLLSKPCNPTAIQTYVLLILNAYIYSYHSSEQASVPAIIYSLRALTQSRLELCTWQSLAKQQMLQYSLMYGSVLLLITVRDNS